MSTDTSMLTQCPHCETVFRVSAEQLQPAQGRVRCGQCRGVFDAYAHPYEEPTEQAGAPPTLTEPVTTADTWEDDGTDDTPPITASRDDDDWQSARTEEVDVVVSDQFAERPAVAGERSTANVASNAAHAAASYIDRKTVLRAQLTPPALVRPASSHALAWSALALLLLLALGGQYVYFTRATLVQYESLRPWLQRACDYAGCDLPLRHAPERIELLSREVISHPRIRAALLINATFVNRAAYVQSYPVLQIALSDENGTVVSMRRFQPEEYLAQGVVIAAGMAPAAPVHVVLEVVEPRQSASSFQFEFL